MPHVRRCARATHLRWHQRNHEGADLPGAVAAPVTGMRDPRVTRRDFLKAASLLATPVAYAHAPNTPVLRAAPPVYAYAYVGTYTPNGGGIYLFRVDRASGALIQIQIVDDIRNPSWLALNPERTRLYAISEIDNYQGTKSGAVVTYAVDADTLRLSRLGAVSSAGVAPTFV